MVHQFKMVGSFICLGQAVNIETDEITEITKPQKKKEQNQ